MTRIYVTGTSCSGKTTLARAISERLRLSHIELDALFWGPRWTPVPDATFRARVVDALATPDWVLDGGYAILQDLTWGQAETVIWLDYPMPTVLGRWGPQDDQAAPLTTGVLAGNGQSRVARKCAAA